MGSGNSSGSFATATSALKPLSIGAEEVAQWLRAVVALAKNPGLVPRIHMMAHKHL